MPEAVGRNSRGATVLLVDDDAGVRKLLGLTLRDSGYEVLEAAGGVEALEVFAAHRTRIRMLITDVVMPDLRGPVVAQRIREAEPRLPVVFITGHGEHTEIDADDLMMHKPFTPNALAAAVRKILG